MSGNVYLVGAGPGAPDLLTVRALRLLENADIVLYDRLVGRRILDLIPAGTELLYVGKDREADSDRRQERIYALMIGRAQKGQTVVRLKGGDPFVFGRGGEEVVRLKEAGILAEIVPGISSCIAAPQSAYIPVTYRGMTASFGVFAGHPGDGVNDGGVDWRAAAGVNTAVFLMGVGRLNLIVDNLIANGRDPKTPIALIQKASLPDEKVVTGTLADILSKVHLVKPPTTIIVGEVVSIRETVLQAQSAFEQSA